MKLKLGIFTSVLLMGSMALACGVDLICAGDRAMDSSGNIGTVQEVFSNGKATMTLDNYSGSYVRSTSTLGKGVRCYERICENDRIIDSSGNFGTAVEVFNNGKAKVSLDNYSGYYTRTISSLGKGQRSVDRLRQGDRVIDSSGNVGTVKEVFNNGKARVELDSYSDTYIRSIDSLGKGYRCIDGICVGNRIMDSSSNVGTVKELFDNGKARVELDRYSGTYIRSFDNLGIELRCQLRVNCSCEN